jgi:hypothetical protein
MKVSAPKTKEEFAAYAAAMDEANSVFNKKPVGNKKVAAQIAVAKKAAGKRPAAKKPVAKTKKK